MLFSVLSQTGSKVAEAWIAAAEDAREFYPRLPGIRFNYVISAAQSSSELSSLHSNAEDRLILKAIRQAADLIVTSGETARSEEIKASPSAPMLILTKSQDLRIPALMVKSENPVFVTNEQTDFENPAAKSVGFITTELDKYLQSVMKTYPCVALEVGLSLAKKLSRENCIDEVCLTVTNCPTQELAWLRLSVFLNDIEFNGKIISCLNNQTTWLFRTRREENR